MQDLPRSAVIVSRVHQVVDVFHSNLLNVVPLNVFEANLRGHQCLLMSWLKAQ